MCSYVVKQPALKNSITFQDVEDTSFFEQYIDGLSSQACGNAMYKVLGVKHKQITLWN